MSAKKLYLAAYNGAQFLGWSYILFKIGQHYANGGRTDNLYPSIAEPLNIFQGAAILEVFHSLFGLVSSPILTTAIQIASRVLLIAVAHAAPQVQSSVFITIMATSWSITEIVRYLFYVLNLYKAVPRFLLWLRYSLFLALYPSGVAGEVGTLYNALPAFQNGLSPILTTAIQIASRVLLIAVAHAAPQVQSSVFITIMATSWSITEIVRYLFYVLNLYKAVPRFLLWLRYSLFLALYPSGVAGEVGTLYNALPAFQNGLWNTPYVSFYYIALFILATYVPGLPFMYSHMMHQRKKNLGSTTSKNKKRS
ncbi:hypothetical protein PROFUN_01140 [Planoprotostelium fungivorum]|uniref:very-long-chain (3R)-3-hydroxyacyl-CoA dehydratase n=1 Tax=Planoprotostelium fungivorum TaxID=1890364 RepID=A0A2P6NCH1_9EUKA|nr:hypothetical protein PROFUN_01140 [Planoprotostelium fungivorum]